MTATYSAAAQLRFSAPLAGARKPVERIVFLNAMIPKPGETGEAWRSNTGQHEAQLEYLATIGVTPKEASDDRVLYFHDVPLDVVAEARIGERHEVTARHRLGLDSEALPGRPAAGTPPGTADRRG